MKIAIMIITIVATLICICACQLYPATTPTNPTQATTMPTQTQPTDPAPTETQPTQTVDPRIAQMQTLLEWPGDNPFYNYALTSAYTTPADVDLFHLFRSGFQDESDDPTDEEIVLLEGKLGEFWKEMDLARLPVDKMNTVLKELFGITLEQTNGVGLDSLVYLEETNCYYTANTGVYGVEISVVYVEALDDGSLMVQYSALYDGDYLVRLMPTVNGGYKFLSNTKISAIYNKMGIRNVVSAYFNQREDYLLGKSEIIENVNPGIVPDEAKHREAIAGSGIEWLQSEISIGKIGCWDSHAEAIVTEEIAYRKDGIVLKETITHTVQLGLTDDGIVLVVCDGYFEKATDFKSCSYVPAQLP